MTNNPLAREILRLRRSKGFSQEKLAELASINLRTLQRIEKGETEPRGDTLRLIAAALQTPPERLFSASGKADIPEGKVATEKENMPENENIAEKEDRSFLQFLNLSALSFWVLPFGNIFVPMFLWYFKKDQVKNVRTLGTRIINFQITWSLAAFLFFCFLLLGGFLQLPVFFPSVFTWLFVPAFYVLNTLIILLASFQLTRGREKIFSASLKIIQ